MNKLTQEYLLILARRTLESYFQTGAKLAVSESELPDAELKEERGAFVTLRKHGQLRGCIGHIEPIQAVYLDVIDNALAAAFDDPRFPRLTHQELAEVEIEVSVLTKPEKLEYASAEDLLNKLRPLQDGVILKKGFNSATYLPQVWEDLRDKQEFLSSLCMKADLPPDEWRSGKLEILTYQAEVFGEKQDF
ncbi:MAG: AmmeMemoRadiSam system protein A [Patescibacteria group bacterium]